MLASHVSYKEFVKALKGVEGAVSKMGTKPIFEGVMLIGQSDSLTLKANNLETAIVTKIPAFVHSPGEIVVNHKQTTNIMDSYKSLKVDDFLLEEKEERTCTFQMDRTKLFNMPDMDPEAFPEFDVSEMEDSTDIVVNTGELISAIEKVAPMAAKDEFMRNLNSVYFAFQETTKEGVVEIIGADGFRMNIMPVAYTGDRPEKSVLINLRSINALVKLYKNDLLESEMVIESNGERVIFKSGETALLTKAVEAEYPEYKRVIPHTVYTTVELESATDLLDSMKRMQTIAKLGSDMVKFAINGEVKLIARAPDHGEMIETMDGVKEGKDITIGFNPKFVIEALNLLKGEKAESVTMKFVEAGNPMMLESSDVPGFRQIIMPIRLI